MNPEKPQPEKNPDIIHESKEISEDEIRQILAKKYDMTFENPDPNLQIPKANAEILVDLGVDQQTAQTIVESSINYLKLPIIFDPNFTEQKYNQTKTEIRDLGEKFGEVIMNNKIRHANIENLQFNFKLLSALFNKNQNIQAQKIAEIASKFPSNISSIYQGKRSYRELSFDEKKAYCKEIDKIIVEFLEALKK